jgi:hypothetical protein
LEVEFIRVYSNLILEEFNFEKKIAGHKTNWRGFVTSRVTGLEINTSIK